MGDCIALRSKYYDLVPAIILPNKEIEICKRRFMLPERENFGFCVASIRRYIKLDPSEAVFFLIDNKIINMSQNVGEFYKEYKVNKRPIDAFLYITIIKETTFG
jgi:hypothetical protein